MNRNFKCACRALSIKCDDHCNPFERGKLCQVDSAHVFFRFIALICERGSSVVASSHNPQIAM